MHIHFNKKRSYNTPDVKHFNIVALIFLSKLNVHLYVINKNNILTL